MTDPERYLFMVTSADDSPASGNRQRALRGVIGKYTMDRILTEGRTVIRSDTQREGWEETIFVRITWVSPAGRQLPETARPPERSESRI